MKQKLILLIQKDVYLLQRGVSFVTKGNKNRIEKEKYRL